MPIPIWVDQHPVGANDPKPAWHTEIEQLAKFRQLDSFSYVRPNRRKRKVPFRITSAAMGDIQIPKPPEARVDNPELREPVNLGDRISLTSITAGPAGIQTQAAPDPECIYLDGLENYEQTRSSSVADLFFKAGPGMELKGYFNQAFTKKAQVQGGIDLTKVRYHYSKDLTCGPRLPACECQMLSENGTEVTVSRKASSRPDDQPSTSDQQSAQSRRKIRPPVRSEPTFSALIFVGQAGEPNSKAIMVNHQQASRWLQFLMSDTDASGVTNLHPQNILTEKGISDKVPTCKARDCHYLMVHDPHITRDERSYVHEPRIWTDPISARAQVFVCSKRPREY